MVEGVAVERTVDVVELVDEQDLGPRALDDLGHGGGLRAATTERGVRLGRVERGRQVRKRLAGQVAVQRGVEGRESGRGGRSGGLGGARREREHRSEHEEDGDGGRRRRAEAGLRDRGDHRHTSVVGFVTRLWRGAGRCSRS